jgi:hypothetical protein
MLLNFLILIVWLLVMDFSSITGDGVLVKWFCSHILYIFHCTKALGVVFGMLHHGSDRSEAYEQCVNLFQTIYS